MTEEEKVMLREIYTAFFEPPIGSGADGKSLIDEMAEKYKHCADIASDRLFGSGHLIDSRYMDA